MRGKIAARLNSRGGIPRAARLSRPPCAARNLPPLTEGVGRDHDVGEALGGGWMLAAGKGNHDRDRMGTSAKPTRQEVGDVLAGPPGHGPAGATGGASPDLES